MRVAIVVAALVLALGAITTAFILTREDPGADCRSRGGVWTGSVCLNDVP